MSNLGNFYQKNKSKGFALSMETSRSFSIFAGKVKKAIEADCKDCGLSLISFHKGHYDFSGFVKRAEDGAIFYFSTAPPAMRRTILADRTCSPRGTSLWIPSSAVGISLRLPNN